MAINTAPFRPSKFLLQSEEAGSERYFSKGFTYEDLLIANGDHINDYLDITQYAKNLYNSYSITLSDQNTLSPLYDMLVGTGGRIDTKENFIRWRIYAKPDRRAISLGNPNQEDACYGGGGIPFKIRLDVDWYCPYDVLVNHRNKRCQLVVQSDPKDVGGAFEYEVILLQNPENAAVFPVELLKESDYFIKMGSLASDLYSNEFGSLQFGFDFSYLEFETNMTTMQWGVCVEKDAHEKWGTLAISRCDDDGRPTPGGTKITNFIEIEGMKQMDYEKELYLAYGTQTDFLTAESTGKRITTGPGLFEFMEEANVIPYNPKANGIDRMVSEIDQLWFDRIAPGQRKLVLYTGQAGLKLFHDWIEEKYGNTAVVTPHDFILGDGASVAGTNGKEYSFGGNYQFTKYKLPIFGEISVAHWAFLDNTRINSVRYPGSHYPVASYEFYAFDIGFGEPNVKLLHDSSEEKTWVVPGMWSPYGMVGEKNPVYKQPTSPDLWGYNMHYRDKFGIVVMDPSKLLRFVPNVVGGGAY